MARLVPWAVVAAVGAHVLARATGSIDRFDETARAVTLLVEHRYGR